MSRARLVLVLASSLALLSTAAYADVPRGTYIPVDETQAEIRSISEISEVGDAPVPTSHGSHILYVNPCWGGETFTSGFNDSRTNRSSIINGSKHLPQYPYGEASYQQVLSCVRDIMSPFNITVVGEDPGSTPHHEAAVCGHPNDAGFGSGTGGVAPFSCGVIENSITYTFPEVYGGQTRAICETIAQEAAHGWGLDHEYLCADPMTYLNGCGAKSFQDEYVSCGEFSARNCQCGGATQNSVQHILQVFGSAIPSPPEVTITEPLPNTAVQPGFVVRADIEDNDGLDSASLYVDGSLVMTIEIPPFVFNAPSSMGDGDHEIEIRAVDKQGTEGSDSIAIVVGEPCTKSSQCDAGEACVDGRCVAGPGTDGGLGESCESGADCVSGLCGDDGSGDKVCTEPCDLEANGCPGGFECRSAGSGGVCWPADGSGGGCAVATRGDGAPFAGLLLLAGVALWTVRRRRRRARTTS
jgi:hypothetical protein